jgi:thiol-disulfide isomerase/thioredoxin
MPYENQYSSYGSLFEDDEDEEEKETTSTEIQDADHRNKILSENSLVCIKLHADWCGPCNTIAPDFNRLAEKYNTPGKCLLVKENVDLKLTTDYKVTSIPCFIFYYKGKLINSKNGNPVSVVGVNIEHVQEIIENFLPHLNKYQDSRINLL